MSNACTDDVSGLRMKFKSRSSLSSGKDLISLSFNDDLNKFLVVFLFLGHSYIGSRAQSRACAELKSPRRRRRRRHLSATETVLRTISIEDDEDHEATPTRETDTSPESAYPLDRADSEPYRLHERSSREQRQPSGTSEPTEVGEPLSNDLNDQCLISQRPQTSDRDVIATTSETDRSLLGSGISGSTSDHVTASAVIKDRHPQIRGIGLHAL